MPTHEYSNGELTVIWQPEKCTHSGICVKTLPQVYDPKARPWVKPGNATTEELKAQINKCPSGALSYRMNKKETNMEVIFEKVSENKGAFKIIDDGKEAGIMTYTMAREIMIIDHTEVKPDFEGRGLGKKLVLAGVEYARKNNLKIKPLCPFALSVFKRTDEITDVLF